MLAYRAPDCGPLSEETGPEDGSAAEARLTRPAVDAKVLLAAARPVVRIHEVAERGAAPTDGGSEDGTDGEGEAGMLGCIQRGAGACGSDRSMKEGLVGVDVADARRHTLVKKRRLDGATGSGQGGVEVVGREIEGVGSEEGPPGLHEGVEGGEGAQAAEASRVAEDKRARAAGCVEAPEHMKVIPARQAACARGEEQLPGHAQVHAEHPSLAGDDGQLLAVTAQPVDRQADQERSRGGGTVVVT